MFHLLSVVTPAIFLTALGDASPKGFYCGSGSYWRSIIIKVDENTHKLTVSGSANKAGAAPFFLSGISYDMSEDGAQIELHNNQQARSLRVIGGFGYPVPKWTNLAFDAATNAITANYRDDVMELTPANCVSLPILPGPVLPEVAAPEGTYCGSGHYWRSIELSIDAESKGMTMSGIANKAGAAPFYLSDISFDMSEDGSKLELHHQESRLLSPIGGFGYPLPEWNVLPFDAATNTITATYKDDVMELTPANCVSLPILPGPVLPEVAAPEGTYCGSGHYWRSIELSIDAESKRMTMSGIANKAGAAPFYLSDISFDMSEDGSKLELHHQESRLLRLIGGFGYPLPAWNVLPFDAATNTITATYKDDVMELTPENCTE